MYDYAKIKELAKTLQAQGHAYKVTDLIALAPQNDPFYVGTETDQANARWFSDLWQSFGYGGNVHLRRVHYQVISQQEPVAMPNGAPYENTLTCWNFLEMASKAARYLEYVDPCCFTDRRNPDPNIFADWTAACPSISLINDLSDWQLRFPQFPSQPDYAVEGFNAVQRYHLEIWVEKSTMNDVLLPLCKRYGVNLVTGVGEQSITSTLALVQRAIDSQKPVRVFYVSDFDPAGRSMPVAVARKAEYYLRKLAPELDFRLFPVVLTQAQCQEYNLPRTPIKETEKRKGHFEAQHGDGATELDALEALHPGELADVLGNAILSYYDVNLAVRARRSLSELEDTLDAIRSDILEEHDAELRRVISEYQTIRGELEGRLTAHRQHLADAWQAIGRALSDRLPDVADFPVPTSDPRREIGVPLFHSGRSYLEQLYVYKEFQGKANGNGFDRLTVDFLVEA